MAGTRSQKRARVESASPAPEAKQLPKRYEQLWFEDGNVMIIAEDTAFRLHRGILSRHSEVFRDMFSIPQPEGDAEIMDGVPVVHLPDSLHDLAHFLCALYDGEIKYFRKYVTVPVEAALALFRLGSKYQVDHVRDEVLSRLERCFPTKLESWTPNLRMATKYPPLTIEPQDSIAVVNLARTYDLPHLLPAALYMCCQLKPNQLVNGIYYAKAGHTEHLSKGDLTLVLEGQVKLSTASVKLTKCFIPFRTSPSCSGAKCFDTVDNDVMPALHEEQKLSSPHALRLSGSWLRQKSDGQLCRQCTEFIETHIRAQRQATWVSLGDIFNVPGWPFDKPAE